MKNLNQIIEALKLQIPNHPLLVSTVSTSDIGWHIDHCLLLIERVINDTLQSDPLLYKSTFNIKKILVLNSGYIPRGKVKAPKVVQPTNYNTETLYAKVDSTKACITKLESASQGQFFSHPFLGNLRLSETKRFLVVHTNHHLKIINDIVASK